LRTLLILMTVCAVVFGLLARWSYKAGQQRDAIIAISGRAVVYYDYETFHPGTETCDYYHCRGVVQGAPAYWPTWIVDALGVDYFADVESVWILNQTTWADDEFQFIRQFTGLKRLGLHGTRAGDAGLERLKVLTSLRFLDLESTTVTDAGLRHLIGLTSLQELYLVNTNVTDAGLQHLQGLTELRYLDLTGTKITNAGVARLHKALPNCWIIR
jgi:hypothetical protein